MVNKKKSKYKYFRTINTVKMMLCNATSINLTCCYKITNEGLKYLTNATTITLSRCDKITDEGLKYLTNATSINLYYCKKITNKGKEWLIKRNPNINIFEP